MKADCPFCDWTQKAGGVYHQHNLARIHLQQKHPAVFAYVEQQEQHIRALQGTLRTSYGKAVKPLNMN